MCGNTIEVKDNRRKYCDACRKVRKHFFDENAVYRARELSRLKRKQTEEELHRLQAEEIALKKEIIRLREIARAHGADV